MPDWTVAALNHAAGAISGSPSARTMGLTSTIRRLVWSIYSVGTA